MKIYNVKIAGHPSREIYDVTLKGEYTIRFEKNLKGYALQKYKYLGNLCENLKFRYKELDNVDILDILYFDRFGKTGLDDLTKALYFEIIKMKYYENL